MSEIATVDFFVKYRILDRGVSDLYNSHKLCKYVIKLADFPSTIYLSLFFVLEYCSHKTADHRFAEKSKNIKKQKTQTTYTLQDEIEQTTRNKNNNYSVFKKSHKHGKEKSNYSGAFLNAANSYHPRPA